MSAPSSLFENLARRAFERCDAVAAFTDVPGMIHRTFCSPAMARLHRELIGWMSAAGMTCRVDAAGNLIGRYSPPNNPHAPSLIIGSHLDTVPNAGRYDGPLGVMLGLALVELIAASGMKLPFAIEVVGFSEEEGVRYGTPFIGSRALIGDCDTALLNLVDREGVSVADALRKFGCDPDRIATAALDPATVIGSIEPHIEQGPVLQIEGRSLSVVTVIAGQTRAEIDIVGAAGHAGTVPMALRHDALAAAAEWIAAVERIGQQTPGLVATVGYAHVLPNVGNVIPGEVRLKLDVRHADDAVRQSALVRLLELGREMATRRRIGFQLTLTHQHSAVTMDPSLTAIVEESLRDTGVEPMHLVSGAGHDAAIMARHFPTAMIFIRCKDGVSHHPDESVEVDDVAAALTALWHFVRRLIGEPGA